MAGMDENPYKSPETTGASSSSADRKVQPTTHPVFFLLGAVCLLIYVLLFLPVLREAERYSVLNWGVLISVVATLFLLVGVMCWADWYRRRP